MASRWRRRALCELVSGGRWTVALTDICGRGALIETDATHALGEMVELHHPEAGVIAARITARAANAVHLSFDIGPSATAFALAAIVSDMTRPGRQ